MSDLSPTRKLLYGFLVVLGFSFWFFLGYPFANHNESFVIVTQLDQMSFGDVLTQRIYPVANYRPLGQAVAWLGYHLAGRTTSGVQLFNYVLAVAAWLVLFFALRERRVFSYAAVLVGGFLFPGYIYLFHLHGVFYSPLLFLFAVLFVLETRPVTAGLLWTAAITALATAFFHPYALPVFIAALVGFTLERPGEFGKFGRILTGAVLGAVVLLVVMVILPSRDSALTTSEMLSGLVVSYRMTEVDAAVAAVVAVLVVLTAWSYPVQTRGRWFALVTSLAGIAIALVLGLPILFVWIGVALVKMVLMKKWWLVFVIAGTALLPAPAASGSPTYTIFAIMACTGALALAWGDAEARLARWGDWLAVLMVCAALVVFALLRGGVRIPVLSRVAQPIFAERERTFQLEEIVRWLVASDYARYEPVLLSKSGNPRSSPNAVERSHRPPTVQEYLSKYTRFKRQAEALPGKTVLVGFGGEDLPGGTVLFEVDSPHSGKARVFLSPAR
ncbi:MAG: hypothetical protein H6Q31_705 [Bacteroidetes bacterium]|nr:hypothetical protein [Bacteroidota bacterium]